MIPVDLGDLTARIHREVKGGRRELYNRLTYDVTATTTSWTFTSPPNFGQGAFLGIDTEIAFVEAVNTAGSSATVMRGALGTKATAHLAGSPVEVNWSRFTADVLDTIGEEISSWPEDVFAVRDKEVALGSGTAVDVDLVEFRHVLRMRRSVTGKSRWVDVTSIYEVVPNLPTSGFPSRAAIFLPSGHAGAGTLQIIYASGYDLSGLGQLSTPLESIGLTTSMIDCAVFGVVWRILTGREAQRSNVDSQPEPRQAEDVRALDAARMAGANKELRDGRLAEEAIRLRHLYPPRWR